MTRDQATAVVAIVRTGAIAQEHPISTLEQWESYLLPLPFEYCRRAAERWVVSTPLDDKGQPVPKFISEPASILTAAGVPFQTRNLLERALRDGGEIFPSLRGPASDGQWERVEEGDTLPRGVAEYYAVAELPLPPGRAIDPALEPGVEPTPIALPAGQSFTKEQAAENRRRFAEMGRAAFGAKKVAS